MFTPFSVFFFIVTDFRLHIYYCYLYDVVHFLIHLAGLWTGDSVRV